jgi:hypothetical protein
MRLRFFSASLATVSVQVIQQILEQYILAACGLRTTVLKSFQLAWLWIHDRDLPRRLAGKVAMYRVSQERRSAALLAFARAIKLFQHVRG